MKLPAIFADHMVLQRNLPIKVWGWAKAGEAIAVTMAGQTARATTGTDGCWQAALPPLEAGGPYEMTVQGASETVTFSDVLIGEVWVCSGQSNMEWPLSMTQHADVDVPAATDDGMRLFTVTKAAVVEVADDVVGTWEVCSPMSVAQFSAVGYYFGLRLRKELGIPIGLINTSWGGTPAESWTSAESLLAHPELRGMVEKMRSELADFPRADAIYRTALKEWEQGNFPPDAGNSGFPNGWADPATSAADWEEMLLPQSWQCAGLDFNGVLWFRREVEIPAAWAGQPLRLRIGACDKNDYTYFNNQFIGSLTMDDRPDAWSTPRCYTVPGELVKAGGNLIAVRVFSNMYNGGMTGPAVQMSIGPADDSAEPLPLAGPWRYQVEQNYGRRPAVPAPPMPAGPGNAWTPTSLYNGMIAPIVPYGIAGAIWYQGESNADRAVQYRTLFPAMIRDWRMHWEQGDFPFLFVQLANYMGINSAPVESNWAELREAQTMTLALPHTGMATIIDIGDAMDIHPKNKLDVGNRLALWALEDTYGKDVIPSGPLYDGMTVEGNSIRLRFTHVAGGLVAKGGPLSGFAIAGADGKFIWADAVIDGDTVVVSSADVPIPAAVRYAWADNPICNLYNAEGLPASPFRT
ncbi:MAG TPA: sialate O-acetylesterase, partial [Armatimonadota bacterium]